MYFFNAKSLLINLWTIIEEEILGADNKKVIFVEDHHLIIALMVISQITLEIKILVAMDLYQILLALKK